MPLTLRARTLLKWNSLLGSTYRASSRRRKALGWHLWGYAYFLACLIFFDRMVLSSCSLSCSNRVIIRKKEGAKGKCNLNANSTIADFCNCLNQKDHETEQKPLLERLQLNFCDTLPFHEHLAFLANAANATECSKRLLRIVNADCVASQGYSKFQGIIERIDCGMEYSVRWKCKDCKEAYKEWICSNLVLPAMIEKNKKTCTHATCRRVLQRCPYFLPFTDYQWSGQSAFECNTEEEDSLQCVAVPPRPPEMSSSSGNKNSPKNSTSVS